MVNLAAAERRQQAAQRDGDIDALDAYRSGLLRMVRLVEESIDVRDDTGVTQIVAAVETLYEGSEVSARLR